MNEPRLEDIEDYNGEESKEKKLTVYLVIVSILLFSAVYRVFSFIYLNKFSPITNKHKFL